MRILLIIFSAALLMLSCESEPEIVIIPDNTAPPDLSVPLVLRENFVNKSYVTLLGRKPTDSEKIDALGVLDKDNASSSNRQEVLTTILGGSEFPQRQYDIARTEILNNLDTVEITQIILLYRSLIDLPEYAQFVDFLQMEIDRALELKQLPGDLANGSANRVEMHRRFVNNYFYDQINMGSQNFVLAMFEYFLGRNPIVSEERNAIAMVDGIPTVVFEVEGDSKDEFIDIFLGSDDYYEGEVINIYRDFLFRAPDSYEMGTDTQFYRENQDYKALLIRILSKDEFIGI